VIVFCVAVRSAILATAWLLVDIFNALLLLIQLFEITMRIPSDLSYPNVVVEFHTDVHMTVL